MVLSVDRTLSVHEAVGSILRETHFSRGHFCDVLASECPCRAAGDFQPAPIRRLEALCTARRGTRRSLTRFQGASHGQPLKRQVDAAYLQPYASGFRFQPELSRFLRAEHQCLLRRLATWQLLRRALSTFPSQKAHLVTAAHCECFFAFCNSAICSFDEFPIPDCKIQNATWHVFLFLSFAIV